MEVKELKKMQPDALEKMLNEAMGKLQEFKFQSSSNQLKNVREIRKTRQNVSRIKTILNDKNVK
ncbi:MAG: 50S ribosomal protein L29 [Patescibacteria group bacterium]